MRESREPRASTCCAFQPSKSSPPSHRKPSQVQINLPVSQREFDYPVEQMLVSTTDTRGFITHCNRAFVAVSGFSYEELIGQNHNIVRHPDMPPEAYKDLWSTAGRGRPWTGMVKNRRKDGDHYWVQANITPIMQNGKPKGYLSVRVKPSRAQIQAAEALYDQLNKASKSGSVGAVAFKLQGGDVHWLGLRGVAGRLQRSSLASRLSAALFGMAGLALLPLGLDLQGGALLAAQAGALGLGGVLILAWFQASFSRALSEAEHLADDLAACNLSTPVAGDYAPPMKGLMQGLRQIQINLKSVVGDVRSEIGNFSQSAQEVAAGGRDLSARTESQASSLQQTAASMEELSSTVKHTAATAAEMALKSAESARLAAQGGEAVREVSLAMSAIAASSNKVRDIIGVIEGIAFQTNILALNAAVEAARAGEQGRGFAVVAAEVRALAKRSAVAAKEIRELIAHSAQQVETGTRQMTEARLTIDDAVKSANDVNQLTQSITHATQEQAQGIAQVNEAVTQLDTVTQQNAALVEQSSASSDELSSGAVTLGRCVQMFHLQ